MTQDSQLVEREKFESLVCFLFGLPIFFKTIPKSKLFRNKASQLVEREKYFKSLVYFFTLPMMQKSELNNKKKKSKFFPLS